ncbi:MAG: MFS transporter [Gammaproteobacteria bacterium]|nr:MFS transporter [Gammaproteobacteria bacterium]
MTISRNLLIALCATFISFCTLYTPQPILPLLANQFHISPGDAGLLMTATLLPLGLAPIVYGYFLQAIPAKLMLTVALVLLMLDQLAFYLADEFWHLLLLRGVQGLLLPAIFTALMTYCASMAAVGQVRRVMGLYIAATILGGYLGRVIGGYFASDYTWQTAYLVMGFVLLIPLVLVHFAKADAEISFARLDIRSISRVLSERNYRLVFLALASIFFVYAGILNLIPFRLYELDPSISPFAISNLYIGYLIGIPIALFSQSFSDYIGDERRSLMLGLGFNAIGLLAFFLSDISVLFVMMFCFAGGFFFIHSTLSGLVNHLAREHKGVVNGLYVSVYYLSGALASWFPGVVYDIYGWEMVMLLLIVLLMVSGWFISKLQLTSLVAPK